MSSEIWEDITGSTERLPPHEKEKKRIFQGPPTHRHEEEEITAQRRARSLQAIFTVMPDAEFIGAEKEIVTAKPGGRRIDFWPATDCYFLHAHHKYGTGIEAKCTEILNYFLQKEREASI